MGRMCSVSKYLNSLHQMYQSKYGVVNTYSKLHDSEINSNVYGITHKHAYAYVLVSSYYIHVQYCASSFLKSVACAKIILLKIPVLPKMGNKKKQHKTFKILFL